jgi:Flp pilus assembly pilin Flp
MFLPATVADFFATCNISLKGGPPMFALHLWSNDEGQDIAEYAVMLAVILVIVIGTVRLIGGHANNVFSSVASEIH